MYILIVAFFSMFPFLLMFLAYHFFSVDSYKLKDFFRLVTRLRFVEIFFKSLILFVWIPTNNIFFACLVQLRMKNIFPLFHYIISITFCYICCHWNQSFPPGYAKFTINPLLQTVRISLSLDVFLNNISLGRYL